MFIGKHPAYYNTWTWHQSSGCGDTSGWAVNQYNLGTGAGVYKDGSISDAACNYLFIDSADGVVINAAGLYPRATVFNNLGIRQTTVRCGLRRGADFREPVDGLPSSDEGGKHVGKSHSARGARCPTKSHDREGAAGFGVR